MKQIRYTSHSFLDASGVQYTALCIRVLKKTGLDFLSARNMVEDAKQQLGSVEFDDILKKTLNFITKCNEIVVNNDNDVFAIEI